MSRFRLKINGNTTPIPPLTITGTPASSVLVGENYSFTPTISGGKDPRTISLHTGTLATGLSFNVSTGAITGSPSGAGWSNNLTIRVVDSSIPQKVADLGPFNIQAVAPAVNGDMTVTMRATESQFVDLSSWLDTIPDENDINVTVTGEIAMSVWPFSESYMTQSNGDPARIWVKRELYPFMSETSKVTAVSNSATVGTGRGTWTFTAKNGANETGTTSQYTVSFDVTSSPVLTHTIGDSRNRAGYGGKWLTDLPGNPSDKTISNQSYTANGGAFAIWTNNAKVATASQNSYSRIAWNGTYGNTNLAVGTPTMGSNTYWVDITDSALAQTWRITFDTRADHLSVSPMSVDTASNNQLTSILSTTQMYASDQVILEDGVHAGVNVTLAALAVNTHPTTGHTVPTSPYNEGWEPHGITTAHNGWITVRSRNPLGASILSPVGSKTVTAPTTNRNGCMYLNFHNISGCLIYPGVSGGLLGHSWLMESFCENFGDFGGQSWNSGNGNSSAMFMVDLYIDGSYYGDPLYEGGSTAHAITGIDSQVVGLWIKNSRVDCINPGVTSTVLGRGQMSWNFITHKRFQYGAHADQFQGAWPGGYVANSTSPYLSLAPNSSVICWDHIGNIMVRGDGAQITMNNVANGDFVASGVSPPQARVSLTLATSVSNTFANGEVVTQPSTGAQGVIYYRSNVAYLKLQNCTGTFSTSGTKTIVGSTSGATANISAISYPAQENEIGCAVTGGQGIFMQSNIRFDVRHLIRCVGNHYADVDSHGIAWAPFANGSCLSFNQTAWDFGVTKSFLANTGYAAKGPYRSPYGGISAPVSFAIHRGNTSPSPTTPFLPGTNAIAIAHNSVAHTTISANNLNECSSFNNVTGYISNYATSMAVQDTVWVNSGLGDGAHTVADVVEAWTPTANSILRQYTYIVGPFGDKSVIDHRRRTFNANIVFSTTAA